jgi:DNA-binding MarR family transcriptional regulator
VTDARVLGDLLMEAARSLRRAALHEAGNVTLAPHQARALRLVCRADGLRPARLAEQLRVTPRSVTDVLDVLVEQRLVERTPDPHDRRAVVLTPTPAGRALDKEMTRRREAAAEAYFAGLGAADRESLGRILTVLTRPEPEAR